MFNSDFAFSRLACFCFNLDFDIYLSLEDIANPSNYLTWYKYEYVAADSEITLTGLKDDTRYYFYAVSRDLAGNIENPLNTTEFYSSNGLYDQVFDLKYIPLLEWNYDIVIEIDNEVSFSGVKGYLGVRCVVWIRSISH